MKEDSGISDHKGPKYFSDELFKEGNEICNVYTKTCIVDEDSEDLCHEVVVNFKCDIPNCDLTFDNLFKYELHYNSCHRFSCSECRKHLPSPHLLDLHLSETHDSFFKVLAERKPMYRCFVESCNVVANNGAERKKHCIEIHKFPHDFNFVPKKKKPSGPMKNKAKSNPRKNDGTSEREQPTIDKMEEDQKKLPKSGGQHFTFGRKTGGKSFNRNTKKPESTIKLDELMDSLPPL